MLLETAINSGSYDECPSPDAWLKFCDGMRLGGPPALATLEPVEPDTFASVLQKTNASSTAETVIPRLADLLWEPIKLPLRQPPIVVPLPPDPWSTKP